MGRTSNVADLVVEAAERFLREDGGRIDRITVDRCYGAVGRGSRSTISSALAGWKALVAKRVIPDKFPVREELFPLIRQLVEASDVLAKSEFAEEQKKSMLSAMRRSVSAWRRPENWRPRPSASPCLPARSKHSKSSATLKLLSIAKTAPERKRRCARRRHA